MKLKKTLSLFLALIIALSFSLTAFAYGEETATGKGEAYKWLMNTLGTVIDTALDFIGDILPVPSQWLENDIDDETGLMSGTDVFLTKSAENARFSLGYDSRSIIDGFDFVGKTYVAGGLSASKKLATALEDNLKVRTVALSDGSQRGISLFLMLDAYGLSLPDVREIRSRLSSFIAEKNINSVTVSVLHQHSTVDTFGMNGDIWDMAFLNPVRDIFGLKQKNGKNNAYMEYLYGKCVETAKAAVNNMTEGALFYGSADETPYLLDKRPPYTCEGRFNRFRFVPDNGSAQTWLVSTEIHCVGNGVQGTVLTADYPYYAEKVINETAGANVFFYMGAQQGTTENKNAGTVESFLEEMPTIESLKGFGQSIGRAVAKIKDEREVSPLLNITYKQVTLPVENPLLICGGKAGMFGAKIVCTGKEEYRAVTEVGYMELGDEFAFAIVPGELAAEIAYGGALQGKASWSGKNWDFPSLQQIVREKGKNRQLMVLDLANDQLSYIVPDNNFMPIIAPESCSIELVSLGKHTGSEFVKAFETVVR